MRQRGRKSASSLAVAPAAPKIASARPIAPQELTGRAAAIWRACVEALPAGWFGPEQLPTLAAFCTTTARAERIEQELDEGDHDLAVRDRLGKMLDREQRRALALARSLRLTKQAQARPEHAESSGPPPVDWSQLRKSS